MNQSFGDAVLIRVDFNPAGRLQGGSASTPVGTIAEIFAGSPIANIQVAGVIDSGYAFIKVTGFILKSHLLPEKILTRRFKAGLIMYGDLFR